MVRWTIAVLLAGCSGSGPKESVQPSADPTTRAQGPAGGSVSVRVVARDVVDPEVSGSADGCDPGPAESVVVDAQGNLAGSAVWVDEAADSFVDAAVRLVDCRFDPRVVLVPPGGTLTLRNDDPVEHALTVGERGETEDETADDEEPLASGEVRAIDLPDVDIAAVRIGPNPWEEVVVIRAGRGMVTDDAGRAVLPGLPPGQHTVHVLHPMLGRRDADLRVSAGRETTLDVLYRAP